MSSLLANIHETTLDNGFKIITKLVPSSPAISNWVWYRTGSRNERSGITGISHWVEHMLFKGTKKFPKDRLDRLLSKHGGVFNAFTAQDYTTYFETLPANQLELALKIEADRMQNAVFSPKDVEAERTVIISERQGAENDPSYLLYEEVLSAAFRVHPYGWPIIGWPCDLKAMTRDDLYGYYKANYSPDNAFLVLVGRFDEKKALEKIQNLFGSIPGGSARKTPVAVEPPQTGERRVVVRKPGNTEYVMAAFHTPEIAHEDACALMLLDAIMSGAKAVKSGPGFERSARLYKALVESQLASFAVSNFVESRDPNLFTFFAIARSGVPVERVEKALLREIDRIGHTKPTRKEMRRSLAQTEAQFAYATDGIGGQAYLIGAFELWVGYRFLSKLLERLSKVTAEDVRRVAESYFTEENRTVGIFKPKQGNSS